MANSSYCKSIGYLFSAPIFLLLAFGPARIYGCWLVAEAESGFVICRQPRGKTAKLPKMS